jgi:RecA-family ATPase
MAVPETADERLNAWRRALGAMESCEARAQAFENAAHDIGSYIARGLEKPVAADWLHDLATAQGLFEIYNEDDIQAVIAEAIEAGDALDRVPDIKPNWSDVSDSGEPVHKPNGKHTEIAALSFVDLALELVPRQWLVVERIPMCNVTLLGGEGAIGKSLLLMQLSGATVLGKDWIGTMPEMGPVLYVSCEEDDDEVRRRMESVAQHFASSRQEMVDRGLQFLSFAGKDAILAQPDRNGIMRPTPLFHQLQGAALKLRPKLICIDTVADTFGGKENDRAQTRQFVTQLRGLAIDTGAAVVIAAHPSLTGIATDSGLSGSTGWHNSVRARMYFKPAPGDDTALRVLEVKKNNYGPVNENILLRWRDGVYVIEPSKSTLEQMAIEAEHDHLFLKLLRRFTDQGRNVSDKKSPTHAPSLFADEPEARSTKVRSKHLAEAMARLFAANRIRVVTAGSPSRMRSHIIEISNMPSNTPSD